MNLSLRNPWLHAGAARPAGGGAGAHHRHAVLFMVRALPGDLAMRVAASRYGLDLVMARQPTRCAPKWA